MLMRGGHEGHDANERQGGVHLRQDEAKPGDGPREKDVRRPEADAGLRHLLRHFIL